MFDDDAEFYKIRVKGSVVREKMSRSTQQYSPESIHSIMGGRESSSPSIHTVRRGRGSMVSLCETCRSENCELVSDLSLFLPFR